MIWAALIYRRACMWSRVPSELVYHNCYTCMCNDRLTLAKDHEPRCQYGRLSRSIPLRFNSSNRRIKCRVNLCMIYTQLLCLQVCSTTSFCLVRMRQRGVCVFVWQLTSSEGTSFYFFCQAPEVPHQWTVCVQDNLSTIISVFSFGSFIELHVRSSSEHAHILHG